MRARRLSARTRSMVKPVPISAHSLISGVGEGGGDGGGGEGFSFLVQVVAGSQTGGGKTGGKPIAEKVVGNAEAISCAAGRKGPIGDSPDIYVSNTEPGGAIAAKASVSTVGLTGVFNVSAEGSCSKKGRRAVFDMRLPQRVRPKCFPSVISVSPLHNFILCRVQ